MLDLESQPLKKKFRAQSRLNQSLARKPFRIAILLGSLQILLPCVLTDIPPSPKILCIGTTTHLQCPAMPSNSQCKVITADLQMFGRRGSQGVGPAGDGHRQRWPLCGPPHRDHLGRRSHHLNGHAAVCHMAGKVGPGQGRGHCRHAGRECCIGQYHMWVLSFRMYSRWIASLGCSEQLTSRKAMMLSALAWLQSLLCKPTNILMLTHDQEALPAVTISMDAKTFRGAVFSILGPQQ